jgi:hypothetical protein
VRSPLKKLWHPAKGLIIVVAAGMVATAGEIFGASRTSTDTGDQAKA